MIESMQVEVLVFSMTMTWSMAFHSSWKTNLAGNFKKNKKRKMLARESKRARAPSCLTYR